MFRAALFLCVVFILSIKVFGQFTTPTILSVHYNRLDFKNRTLFQHWNHQDAGAAISFVKGINSHFDWSIAINGSFPDSALKAKTGGHLLFLQTEAALRARLFKYPKWWQPFLQASTGAALYNKQWTPMVGMGTGLQLNAKGVYLLMNLQYQQPLQRDYKNYLQYSIGIGGVIGKKKKAKPQSKSLIHTSLPTISDKDGDGLVDSTDMCPIEPGLAIFAGCPDRDGDGLPDHLDHCPTVKGLLQLKGCPLTDTDNDGIQDDEDSCITIPGVVKYKGCPVPDTDGDGVDDESDSCRIVAGVKEKNGCPLVTTATQERVNEAAQQIYFKTGRASLTPVSFKALDRVVQVLQEYPGLLMEIEGHTDNEGTEQGNQKLSRDRAAAVVRYLTSKGIAPGRLTARGLGASWPIADNTTKEGQARNRRVVLLLK